MNSQLYVWEITLQGMGGETSRRYKVVSPTIPDALSKVDILRRDLYHEPLLPPMPPTAQLVVAILRGEEVDL
jgi:hypothetical protein